MGLCDLDHREPTQASSLLQNNVREASGRDTRVGAVSLLAIPVTAFVFVACGSRNIDGAYGFEGSGGSSPIVGGGASSPDGSVSSSMDGGVIIDGCRAEPHVGEQTPLDLFFMVDKSASMYCPLGAAGMNCVSAPIPPPLVTRWSSMKEALTTFAMAPASAGLGAGIGFFPQLAGNTLLCAPFNYATPAAEIEALPGSARALATSLDAQTPSGNTPTVPALGGAFDYATRYAAAHPGRTVAVIFATDGEPTSCAIENNTIAGAVSIAQSASRGVPPIKTYVLGVGPNLANLNQIAAAGGTGQAHLVESGGSQDLLTALGAIRTSAFSCDYAVPVTVGKPLDFNEVNVQMRLGSNGMARLIARTGTRSSCGANGGWYYDDNAAPTRILLCPASCEPLTATVGSAVTVLVGCKSVTLPS
jgi:hypothetical protein